MHSLAFEWFDILTPSEIEDLVQSLIVQHSRFYNVTQLCSELSSVMWKLLSILKLLQQVSDSCLELIAGFYKTYNYIQ